MRSKIKFQFSLKKNEKEEKMQLIFFSNEKLKPVKNTYIDNFCT